jgi:hypothetical protein
MTQIHNDDVINTLRRHASNQGVRFDDAQTAMLELELEALKSRVYEVRFQELKGRQLVPFNTETDRGAESIAWEVMSEVGEAKVGASADSDDIPLVEVSSRKESKLVYNIVSGYRYSINDMWAAAFSGRPLNDRRGRTARRSIERRVDDIVATGIEEAGIPGLINHGDVDDTTPDNGDWTNAATTYLDIAQDVAKMVGETVDATKDIFRPDCLVLPTKQFIHLATKPVSANGDARTVLNALRDNLRELGITCIMSWNRLEGAGATATDRAVLWLRDPEVLEFDMPLDFFQLPPEPRGLGFVVPVMARVAGLTIHHPAAVRYMDGI